ncbi:Ubiquitin-conjugating enzyme E2 22 [Senna tora]|uniref:Ubiquitin-conjugating enzyme E2 22 n=1 Tax=Senna tora TaxID=362788 RepID=A0A834TBX0_9FABA|nr:Ubiquitin-conjugating enzyme E2 22 [Senna tora]
MLPSWLIHTFANLKLSTLFSEGLIPPQQQNKKSTAIASLAMATNENLPPNVIKQLAKELKNLDESPPEGIKVVVNDDDFSTIYADIEGPGM